MTRYIGSLPVGLDSHPHCKSKASLVRSMLDGRVVEAARGLELPDAVARLIEAPPPVSSWIPEAHSNATLLLVQDLSGLDDTAYRQLIHGRMRELFDGPLYRVLFRLSSPTFLIRTAAYRWRSFHRGTEFMVEQAAPGQVTVRIGYPTQLWNAELAMGLLGGLQASLDMSGAREPSVELAEVTPTWMRVTGRWT